MLAFALVACGAVSLTACNALIGAEDRFFESDAATRPPDPPDATTPIKDSGAADTAAPIDVFAPDASDASRDGAPPLSPYAAAVTADTPVAWWRLDDPVGSTFAVDQLGSHNAAVTGDGLKFGVDGAVGTAVDITGAGYLDVGNFFDLVPGGAFTMEAWVKAGWTGFEDVFIKRDESGNGYAFYLEDGPQMQFEESYAMVNAGFAREDPDPAVVDSFAHVVMTYDPALGYEMYINGIQADEDNVFSDDSGVPVPILRNLYLGPNLAGQLDEVALYDHALSLERVGAHYQAGLLGQ